MPSSELRPAKQTIPKDSDECVLLIEPQVGEAARILEELGSAPAERFRVEGVTELSTGIERLRDGGVGAVVLDLTSPDSHGVETFDKLFQSAARVPILILTGAEAEEMARKDGQHGAQDYLVKNQADCDRLRRTVRTMTDRRAAAAMLFENEVANATLDSIGEA